MTHHHVFSKKMVVEMELFARNNYSKPIQEFKQQWNSWLVTHKELIESEEAVDDMQIKLYNSVRHYYTKKIKRQMIMAQEQETTKATAIDDKPQASDKIVYYMTDQILAEMQTYIEENYDVTIKPDDHFAGFCTKCSECVKQEIAIMLKHDIPLDSIKTRLKKSFKNKYAIHRRGR